MKNDANLNSRRKFFKKSAIITAGLISTPLISFAQPSTIPTSESIYLIGQQEGYSPQIGTLLSTMTLARQLVIDTVKDLTVEQLDFQIDGQSNSIGAMLLHLAACERYFQLNTFDEMAWGTWSKEIKNEWDVPMHLGEKGRKQIKGNDINYYLSKLEEVRSITKKEFAKRDDDWITESESFFEDKPTNKHCKWFHICKHDSNHFGQMKFIMKRIPS